MQEGRFPVEPDADDPYELTFLEPDAPVTALEQWRRRTATGALITAVALGLREVFEPERRQQPVIVDEAGDPYTDDGIDLFLSDSEPRATLVFVRPWLLRRHDG